MEHHQYKLEAPGMVGDSVEYQKHYLWWQSHSFHFVSV